MNEQPTDAEQAATHPHQDAAGLRACRACAPLRHPSQATTRRALAAHPIPRQAGAR
ncbi:hypothetical protein [Streptomyces sp. NPDC060194]|uniref:hypothetical protein n=1 Tax=Streptomyces sp. NPDC060194 TaxID=3347069 RepID=UPI00366A48E5